MKMLAGCVVLYYPGAAVVSNVESYIFDVDVLFIIDNSETVNKALISKICSISEKVKYIPQSSNIGIASALNLGARLALENNYEWLLTMDQDSYFTDNRFFIDWQTENPDPCKIGIVAASYTDQYEQWQKKFSRLYNETQYAITSGNIISLKAWKSVQGFEDKLFIDEVDHDYCLKLRMNHYKVLLSKNVYMVHQIGKLLKLEGNGIKEREELKLHSPVRYYYISRNVLYVCKKYLFIDFRFVLSRFYYLIKGFAKIVLLYPHKSVYFNLFFAGVKDFTLSRFNKYENTTKS